MSSTATGRNLKRERKAVVEDNKKELEFRVLHDRNLYLFNVSKDGISFEKVRQSVAQALTLQRDAFSLEYLARDTAWVVLKDDDHMQTCIELLGGRDTIRLRVKINNRSTHG